MPVTCSRVFSQYNCPYEGQVGLMNTGATTYLQPGILSSGSKRPGHYLFHIGVEALFEFISIAAKHCAGCGLLFQHTGAHAELPVSKVYVLHLQADPTQYHACCTLLRHNSPQCLTSAHFILSANQEVLRGFLHAAQPAV